MALHDVDFFEVLGAFYALDSWGAREALCALPSGQWVGLGYDWKSDHPEEHHEFLQYAVGVLPADTPFERVLALTEDYLHPIVFYPNAVDIAAETAVRFWNAHPQCRTPANARELRDYLTLLEQHPDSERVPDIAGALLPLTETKEAENF